MKAIFEVEFDPTYMCDEEALQSEYGGSWLKCMKYLFKEESMGIFDKEFKLISIEESKQEEK